MLRDRARTIRANLCGANREAQNSQPDDIETLKPPIHCPPDTLTTSKVVISVFDRPVYQHTRSFALIFLSLFQLAGIGSGANLEAQCPPLLLSE
jgi:hypothetical protein